MVLGMGSASPRGGSAAAPPALEAAIRRLEDEPGLYERLSAAGLAHAEKFTDAAFAGRLAAMYAKIGVGG